MLNYIRCKSLLLSVLSTDDIEGGNTMKKLFTVALTLALMLPLLITTASAEDLQVVHNYTYDEVVHYDYAKITAKQHDAAGENLGTFKYLVTLLGGDDVAETVDLGLAIFNDGRIAIRHKIENGYQYYFDAGRFVYLHSVEDNGIHILIDLSLISEICANCAFAK